MRVLPAGEHTAMVGQYVIEKLGIELTPGMYQAFMVVNDSNDFVAAVIISNFRGMDCDVTCVSENPAAWRPHVCKAIFTYIFTQLGCVRCTSITTKGNHKARSFLESLGFQLEGKARLAYDGRRDAMIYGLLKEECRYLAAVEGDTEHGQIIAETASSARPGSDGERASERERSVGNGASGLEPHQPSDAPREPYLYH